MLLGHVHTHEFACGGTTDQVGNPWALERSAGGSGGGSSAALASRQVPAATGTDTAGSLRIPSAECGTSTIKPTRGSVSMRGVVPLAWTFDHPGPMTRTVVDSELVFAGMAGVAAPDSRRPLRRYAVSPRISVLEPDVADGFDRALAALPGERVEPPTPPARLDVLADFFDLVLTEMLVYHRRFDDRRDGYRPSNRGRLEHAERRAMTAEEYIACRSAAPRTRTPGATGSPSTASTRSSSRRSRSSPPCVAAATTRCSATSRISRSRTTGTGRASPSSPFPPAWAVTAGCRSACRSIGAPGADWDLLDWGAELQDELGTVTPP